MYALKVILIVALAACFVGGCATSKQTIATKKAFYDTSFNARGDSNANGPSNRSDSGDK